MSKKNRKSKIITTKVFEVSTENEVEKTELETPTDAFTAPNRIIFEVVEPAKIDFDSWWKIAKQKHELKRELKDILKRHFEARGFMKSMEYWDGLRDFGIK